MLDTLAIARTLTDTDMDRDQAGAVNAAVQQAADHSVTAAAGVKRSEWVRARLVEAADEAERYAAQCALGSANPAQAGVRTGAS